MMVAIVFYDRLRFMDIKPKRIRLIEGQDYYLEDGLMVFTSTYHIHRGFCCRNECRHCPYTSLIEKPKKSKSR
jgi:hypothetical protein